MKRLLMVAGAGVVAGARRRWRKEEDAADVDVGDQGQRREQAAAAERQAHQRRRAGRQNATEDAAKDADSPQFQHRP